MAALYSLMILILSLGFGVGLWWVISRYLRKQSGFVGALPFDPGPELGASRIGTMRVDRVRLRNCVRMTEHAEGYVLHLSGFFGGGVRWLPREVIESASQKGGWLRMRTLEAEVDGQKLRLEKQLVGFVSESLSP